MNAHALSSPQPSQPRREWVTLLLKLLAVAAAGGAQAYVFIEPRLSLVGFAAGGLLFLWAERRAPAPPPDAPPRHAPSITQGFWTVFAVGYAFCLGAGVLVYRGAAPALPHIAWLLGLSCFCTCAAYAWWRSRARRLPSRRTLASILLLLVLAGGFFAWNVSSIPPEVHGDEGEEGMDAVELLHDKPFNLFTVGWYWLPRLHVLRQAAGMKVFGVNLLGLRISSVVLGAAGVLLVFAVGTQLWSFEVGLLAGLILVSARFFIHLSRTGLEYLDTPVLSILVVWLAWWVWRDLRIDAAIACGIALGLGIQSYYASRLVPVLLTVTWGVWLVGSEPRLRLTRINRLVIIGIVALATVAPMAGYFARHPIDLWMRTMETSAFSRSAYEHLSYGYGTRDFRYILLVQLLHAVTLFNYTGDSSLQYGYGPGGLFEPIGASLFALGFFALWAHPLRRRNLLLILWIVVPVIVGGALTIDTPFYPRIGGVVAFAVLVVALALHSVLTSVRDMLPHRTARVVVPAITIGVIAAVFANNIQNYFFDYAPRHRHGPGAEIAAWIRAHGAGKTTYMVGGRGFYIKHGTIRFLSFGYTTQDIVDLDLYLRTSHFDRTKSLFIIMPQGKDLIPKLEADVGPLDVQPQSFRDNPAAFYTAIPVTQQIPSADQQPTAGASSP